MMHLQKSFCEPCFNERNATRFLENNIYIYSSVMILKNFTVRIRKRLTIKKYYLVFDLFKQSS